MYNFFCDLVNLVKQDGGPYGDGSTRQTSVVTTLSDLDGLLPSDPHLPLKIKTFHKRLRLIYFGKGTLTLTPRKD